VFHTDSEKFSHALSVLNVLLADWCARSPALPRQSGRLGRVMSTSVCSPNKRDAGGE